MSDSGESFRREFRRLSRIEQTRREDEEMEREYEERYRAAHLLDEVLVLFDLYQEDYNVIEASLAEIARYRNGDPDFPITASLYEYMDKRGYFKG